MIACPECGDVFPEPILLRHREFTHPTELEAEGSAQAEQVRAARESEATQYTADGFLKRTGAKPDAPPTDSASLLGRLFPSADPGAASPPWERERGPV